VGRCGPISKLAEDVPRYVTTPDIRLSGVSAELIESIAQAFPPERVSRLDGIRVQFDDGWGLARMSVTEPVMTLRFEARDEATLRSVIDRFLAPAPELRKQVP